MGAAWQHPFLVDGWHTGGAHHFSVVHSVRTRGILGAAAPNCLGTYLLLLITTALMLRRTATAKSQPLRTNQSKEPPTSELSDEDLREHCCELSAEIREFYKRQQEDFDKRLRSDLRAVFLQEEPHRSQWRAEETERHEMRMVDRYSELLGGAVSTLCDDLELRGWCTPEDRNRFENPTGLQDIRYTAQRLEAICRRSDVVLAEGAT